MSMSRLKSFLVVDAVTCIGVFAVSLLASAPVAALLGVPVQIVAIGGWICLAAGLLMLVAAARAVPNAGLVKLIAVGNIGWVAASLGVVATFAAQMAAVGIIVVLAQAVAVLAFAIIEWKGAGAGGRAVTA